MVGRTIVNFLLGTTATLILCIVAPASASAALGANLISNPSLEQGTTAPTGWEGILDGTGNNATFTYPAAAYDGSRGARITVTVYKGAGDIFWMPSVATVTAGKQYQFKSYYRSNKSTVFLATYIKSGGATSYETLATVSASPTTGDWAPYTKTLTIPTGVVKVKIQQIIRTVGWLEIDAYSLQEVTTGTTPAPTCTLSASPATIENGAQSTLTWTSTNGTSATLTGFGGVPINSSKVVQPSQTTGYTLTVKVDGGTVTCSTTVTVTQTTPPPTNNIVKNGGFETASANASIPSDWNTDYWGSMTPTFAYPVAGKGGGKAARVSITRYTSGDAKWWFTHIPVSSHTLYQFTDNYISSAVTNITVEFKMSNGTYQYQWLGDAPIQTAWGTFSTQITVPTGAVSFTVFHALQSNGSLTIDNVSVVSLPADPFPTAMVSLVFDDGLASQITNARSILNTAGIKGVFGIITQSVGSAPYMTWTNITALKNEGHEISGHTRTHPDLTTLNATQLQSETKGSYDDLVAHGFTPKTFVYPYGATNTKVQTATQNAGYTGARGSYFGLNAPSTDRFNLFDIRLDKTSTLAGVKTLIDQAIADKRWLVLELHDVLASGGDEYTVTPNFLQAVVNYIKQKGVSVVTLEQGIALMTQ